MQSNIYDNYICLYYLPYKMFSPLLYTPFFHLSFFIGVPSLIQNLIYDNVARDIHIWHSCELISFVFIGTISLMAFLKKKKIGKYIIGFILIWIGVYISKEINNFYNTAVESAINKQINKEYLSFKEIIQFVPTDSLLKTPLRLMRYVSNRHSFSRDDSNYILVNDKLWFNDGERQFYNGFLGANNYKLFKQNGNFKLYKK